MEHRQYEQPEAVRDRVRLLRIHHNGIFGSDRPRQQGLVIRAFAALASLWERRLAAGWTPPPADSGFPWAQVRLSLAALLPGFLEAERWLGRSTTTDHPLNNTVVALVLAGNTPLLAWSPLAAALLSGQAVFVKQSRDETLWTRLFVESLAEVDAEFASLIHLDLWPGEDPRTTALVEAADAVIAYGSDATLAALQGITPEQTPFFGFGNAVSIGIVAPDGVEDAGHFARDILLYNQGGCLSAQAILVEEHSHDSETVRAAARNIARSLEQECNVLQIPPVTDPAVARSVRQARDMALFVGSDVSLISDAALRWTLILRSSRVPLEFATGACVVQIVPVKRVGGDLHDQLGEMRGCLSSVGVAGTLTELDRRVLLSEGISRLCQAGQMQMPPLDWPNSNRNLLAELLKTKRQTESG